MENSATFPQSGLSYNINLYRFLYYYLTPDSSRMIYPYDCNLYMVKWQSGLYADYNQLHHIYTDSITPMGPVGDKLEDEYGVTLCWDPTEKDAEKAFYEIGSFNSPLDPPMTSSSHHYMMRAINQNLTIAFNRCDSFPLDVDVPGFAAREGHFPAGFEIGAVGPTAARKVLVRMVVAGRSRKRLLTYSTNLVVAAPEY